VQVKPVSTNNHRSAFQDRDLTEAQIKEEIGLGNYVVTSIKPSIVSPIGAVPKDSGKIRLIHDGSLPVNAGMNSYMVDCQCEYMDLKHAVKLIKPGSFLAKLDLKSAYRSVNLHPSNFPLTGLCWRFHGEENVTYLYDSKLPFGASKSPRIFQTLSAAVCRIMKARFNIDVIAYIDDFLVVCDKFEQCAGALQQLVTVIRELGFSINWTKVDGPAQNIVFLGIVINTVAGTLALPAGKLGDLQRQLEDFSHRKRASKKQLERLIGRLSWASMVIQGGRTFLRRVLDLKNSLNSASAKCELTSEFQADIGWWLNFLIDFNGTTCFLDSRPIRTVSTDACNAGAGGYFNGDFFYTNWKTDMPEVCDMHINIKETLSIVLAACRWCAVWKNKRVIIKTDNKTARAFINKGSCKIPFVMTWLRHFWWLKATFNFSVRAVYIPGHENVVADAISRLHEPGRLSDVFNMLPNLQLLYFTPYVLCWHMSSAFYLSRWGTAARTTAEHYTATTEPRLGGLDEAHV